MERKERREEMNEFMKKKKEQGEGDSGDSGDSDEDSDGDSDEDSERDLISDGEGEEGEEGDEEEEKEYEKEEKDYKRRLEEFMEKEEMKKMDEIKNKRVKREDRSPMKKGRSSLLEPAQGFLHYSSPYEPFVYKKGDPPLLYCLWWRMDGGGNCIFTPLIIDKQTLSIELTLPPPMTCHLNELQELSTDVIVELEKDKVVKWEVKLPGTVEFSLVEGGFKKLISSSFFGFRATLVVPLVKFSF